MLFAHRRQVIGDCLDILDGELLECVIRLDLLALVENRCHGSFFGDLVVFRAFRSIECKADVFDIISLLELLNLFLHIIAIGQEDDDCGDFAFPDPGNFGIQLLDQTGQGVVGIACEDQSDWFAAELSDKATLFAVPAGAVGVKDIQGIKWCNPRTRLRAGLQITSQHDSRTDHHACQ